MSKFFKSMLTTSGEISLGSFCMFIMVVVYTTIMICAFFMERNLPVTGYEFASIIGAIYGLKKIPTVVSEYYSERRGKPIDASIRD